ncbi:hypothetical protein GGR57DRAFT_420049 [Xylariaceae sp. FL1272]|nr:hypothetical protein GGR57DRAFT_420049 [Xylariaceae sp. FL1272]
MAICTVHIISLKTGVTLASLLAALRDAGIKPVAQARVLRWMILPTVLSAGDLLARNIHWDAVLILPESAPSLLAFANRFIAAEWTASVGTSSKMIAGYAAKNSELLSAPGPIISRDTAEARTAESSGNLEVTPELMSFIDGLPEQIRSHPVSMLNLLAFNDGMHGSYVEYGKQFSERVGKRFGGQVKIVGKVVSGENEGTGKGWEEVAFVHYPSIQNFASMASDEAYQDVNKRYRLGALRDTFILCVMEVGDDGELVGRPTRGKL